MTVLGAVGESGLNQILAKRLTTPGAAVAPGVAPELFPNLVLENDRPEWKYLAGEKLASMAGFAIAAVAASISTIRLRNPLGSNVLAIFEEIEVQPASATDVVISRITESGALGTEGGTASRDTRFADDALVTGHCRIQVTGGAIMVPGLNAVPLRRWFSVASGERVISRLPYVLSPGNAIDITTVTENITLLASAAWRERAAQPGELV